MDSFVRMMFSNENIVWQEVPGHVSLAFTISGCSLRCLGCHSAETWLSHVGQPLTPTYLQERLELYRGLITCVAFMDGEWHQSVLCELLDVARAEGLHTCLYTGEEDVNTAIKRRLTFLKTGPYRAELGGLDSPKTNQRFVDLTTNQRMNHCFLKR